LPVIPGGGKQHIVNAARAAFGTEVNNINNIWGSGVRISSGAPIISMT
jgi:hypothetical protein